MPIQKRKHPKTGKPQYRFIANYRDRHGNRCRKGSKWYAQRKDAADAERRFLKTIEKDSPTKAPVFRDVFEDWLVYSDTDLHNTPRSILEKRRIIERYFADLLDRRLDAIKPATIRAALTTGLCKHLSAKTRNKALNYCGSVYKFATKFYEFTGKNPAASVGAFKDPRKPGQKATVYTPEQFAQFIAAMDPDDDYTGLFQWIYWLGFRRSECMALTFGDLQDGVLHVWRQWDRTANDFRQLKTESSERYIRLPASLIAMYNHQRFKYERYPDFDPGWFIFGGPTICSGSTMDRRKNAAIDEAGLPYITNHQLRHSYISNMLEKESNAWLVARSAGHANSDITQRVYGHVQVSDFAQDIEDLMQSVNTPDLLA